MARNFDRFITINKLPDVRKALELQQDDELVNPPSLSSQDISQSSPPLAELIQDEFKRVKKSLETLTKSQFESVQKKMKRREEQHSIDKAKLLSLQQENE